MVLCIRGGLGDFFKLRGSVLRRCGALGDEDGSGLGEVGGSAGAVDGEGDFMTGAEGGGELEEAVEPAAGAGAANGDEAHAGDDAGDEFAVERGGDEDVDVPVAVLPGGEQEGAVEEGVEVGVGVGVGGTGAGIAERLDAEGEAEGGEDGGGKGWEDGEQEPLLPGEGRWCRFGSHGAQKRL